MVGRDDKQGVLEPRLAAGGLKESLQGIVGVGNALLQGTLTLRETALVLLGNDKRVVA